MRPREEEKEDNKEEKEEEGKQREKKRFKEDTEHKEEGMTQSQASQEAKEGKPATPVAIRVRRWNKRIEEGVEGGEGRIRTPRSSLGEGKGPTGKRMVLKQPTLSSFLNLRSGLEGSGGKKPRHHQTSPQADQEMTGKGPPPGPEEGSLQIFGEGGGRPRIVHGGSPEHNLLMEAQVLIGGSHSQGEPKEGRGDFGGFARKLVRWPPEGRNEEETKEDNARMVGPSRVGKIPTSRAEEIEDKGPRTRLFPRE